MKFKDWLKLQEVGTGTNSIAAFARPLEIAKMKRKEIPLLGYDKDVKNAK